ncbi:N-acetylglucosamine-6-phosphate deacetylase [Prauserella oleivorans]|uniref:N-acetylglucosamine-6-phosphate deacetylase n=1 Tax=Prauserella oleivorans TaxID=1478153 RepID=A0ABW5WGJ6_9PSEU
MLTGGRVAFPDGVADDGWLRVSGGVIADVGTGTPPDGPRVDAGGALVVPGFIDTHCHGGGGAAFSTTDPAEAARAIAAHRRHGTTTMLASLVTDPVPVLADQLAALSELVEDGELAGVHLEGPFLAAPRCGAHDPASLRDPDSSALDTLLDAGRGHVRMMTLAPELPGGVKAVHRLVESGVVAAIGHTDGTGEQVRAAVDAGATVATHLYNGMRPLHHREPGPIAVLLEDERVTIELICDLVHVHPTMVRLAAKHAGRGRTVLVTDAMSATGAADGAYTLGKLAVDVHDGVATLPGSGALAGSTLTMDAAFRNFVHGAGMSIEDAVWATASRPAELLGIADRTGRLSRGLQADLVLLGDDLRPKRVLRRGLWNTEGDR